MKLRWILPPLAALTLGGLVWVITHGDRLSPEEWLAAARAARAAKPPGEAEAQRALDQGLKLVQPGSGAPVRGELLLARAELYADQKLPQLALGDCRARLAEFGPEADTLALACDQLLLQNESGLALEFAEQLAPLDPARGKSRIGRCRIALADSPLASVDRLARTALPLSVASTARALAQRAAVFADEPGKSSAALDEVLTLFARADQRRQVSEWVAEAAEHMRTARVAFVESLEPGSSTAAVAGLQDLLLRGGAEREAADLGWVALAPPGVADSMPVLARTASALVELGRLGAARALILDLRGRGGQSLHPELLPSHALRDELLEWCLLLERLQLWPELRCAAWYLAERSQADDGRTQLALFLAATADLRENQLEAAQRTLDLLGTNPLPQHDVPMRAWFARAEIARKTGQKTLERYALITGTKSAPLDAPAALRAELGRAWQRLYQIQQDDGDLGQAEVSLTHALRCSPERAAELEPLWVELGQQALATRGASSPYLLYARAKNQDDRGLAVPALSDAHELLKTYPGLGPALEIVSRAANKLRDFPQMIAASLELLERGWPGAGASARLRDVPKDYFLPQDRVRWMRLDPRGSLEAVVRRLLAKGDVRAAALAARGGPAKFQPPELLPLLAEVELAAGLPNVALDTLELLPADGAPFRSATSVALKAALQHLVQSGQPQELDVVLQQVFASGAAEDARMLSVLDLLLCLGRPESATLLAWLAPQQLPFLDEYLLRAAAQRLIARSGSAVDDDLERATALLEDGRPELGRILFALELGDLEAVAREARAALTTPLAADAGRRAALLLLADEPSQAAEVLSTLSLDGRALLPELCASALALAEPPLAADALPSGHSGLSLSAQLLESVPLPRLLALALAAEVPPWSSWTMARTNELEPATRSAPWIKLVRSQAWLALGEPALAQSEFALQGPAQMALLWWQRARVAEAAGAPRAKVLENQLGWLAADEGASESASADGAWLALLRAEEALAADEPERAVRGLELALEAAPGEPALLARLAELESTDGRRTRAIELYGALFASAPGGPSNANVPAYLELLDAARAADEISEARWWSEVEALEAERPLDPALPRALAKRSFEDPGTSAELRRTHALEHLERFRARTLGRSLETLRAGEVERWTALLAHYVPERAVEFAQAELLRDPSDPALWRAAARAELAAGRWQDALARLETLQRVAPERETARLLALTGYRIENDPKRFQERMASIERIDAGAKDDPTLSFYLALSSAGLGAKEKLDTAQRAYELWNARAENGLADPEHGRALALTLFLAGKKGPALKVLAEAHDMADGALDQDLIEALAYLIRSCDGLPHRILPVALPAPSATTFSDDLPAGKKGNKKGSAPPAGDKKQAPRKAPPEGAAGGAAGGKKAAGQKK
ncbi:MAG: hypothetical protein EXS08_05720 [Planctomycetes bacterium]|nr:hypothetical protein [Planctomycetota bacterium]